MTDVFSQLPLSAVQPGAYAVLDTTALTQTRGLRRGVLGVLGAALGGAPNTPLNLYATQDIKSVLRGGILMDAARIGLEAGSTPIVAVRIGTGIAQGSVSLVGAAASALTLTALGWGAWTNAIKVTVAASNAVTVSFTDSLTGVTYTENYTPATGLTGNAALVNIAAQINGTVAGIPKSALVSAVASATDAGPLVTNGAGTNLTAGADNATLTGTDWTAGLKALETANVDYVAVATNDATIHAQAVAHCLAMSTPTARKERRAIFGGALGDSVAQTVTRATTAGVASRRGQLVYPGIQLFDVNGNIVLYEASMAAIHVAGRKCALQDMATSMMHQRLNVLGAERDLSSIPGGDLDTLLRANVTPIAPATGAGYWITDDLSLEPADPNWRDWVKQGAADRVAQRLRNVLETKYTGAKALGGSGNSMALTATSEGAQMKGEELIRDFQPATVAEQPGNPGTFAVTLPTMLIGTTRFIGIVVALQPASTTQAPAAAPAF